MTRRTPTPAQGTRAPDGAAAMTPDPAPVIESAMPTARTAALAQVAASAERSAVASEHTAGVIYMARAHNAVLTPTQIQERWARGVRMYRA